MGVAPFKAACPHCRSIVTISEGRRPAHPCEDTSRKQATA